MANETHEIVPDRQTIDDANTAAGDVCESGLDWLANNLATPVVSKETTYYVGFDIGFDAGFKAGAKWMAERMTEEDDE